MNRQQFSELVSDPGILNEATIGELQDLLKVYPYCQTAQILLTFNLFQQNHPEYQAQLKKAVAYAGDRRKLKEFLEGKKDLYTAVLPGLEPVVIVETPAQASDQTPPEVSDKTPVVASGQTPPEASGQSPLEPSGQVPSPATVKEPEQENYIAESFITSEELALASPRDSVSYEKVKVHSIPEEEVKVHSLQSAQVKGIPVTESEEKVHAIPLHATLKPQVSLEKLTQDELLSIVRKRLAEINDEVRVNESAQGKLTKQGSVGKSAQAPGIDGESGKSKNELIEKFIREEPQISRPKKEFFSPAASSQKSNLDDEDIVSETLALLYAKQGNLQKAIHIYEKLSLRFSEKSRYFAAQIENLKGHTSQ